MHELGEVLALLSKPIDIGPDLVAGKMLSGGLLQVVGDVDSQLGPGLELLFPPVASQLYSGMNPAPMRAVFSASTRATILSG